MTDLHAAPHKKKYWSLTTYLLHHQHAIHHGLRQLTKNPFSSLLTIFVMSITFLLPMSLFLILTNMKVVIADWQNDANISIYLSPESSSLQISNIKTALQQITNIVRVTYISPQQGLQEFAKISGLGNTLKTLGNNPLPPVFEIYTQQKTPVALNLLAAKLQTLPAVKYAKIDIQWIKRVNSIISLLERLTYGVTFIFALAVLLIIANTIRTSIQSYRNEIKVMKLIGGSDSFIRRPFLYSGVFYSLLSSFFSVLILNFLLLWLQTPLDKLTALYHANLSLHGLSLQQIGLLNVISILLGIAGSWYIVDKHLQVIQAEANEQ